MRLVSKHYKETLNLAFPVILSYFVDTLLPFINTYFAAKINHESIAALSLSGATFVAIMGFCWGIITAIGIIISKKIGAKRDRNIGIVLKAGILCSFIIGFLAMILLYNFSYIWKIFKIDDNLVNLADSYLKCLSFAVIPDMIKYSILQYAISFERTKIPIVSSLTLIPLIYFLNNGLCFGLYGLPEYNLSGLGIGTSISMWIVAFLTFVYIYYDKQLGAYLKIKHTFKHYILKTKKITKIGYPIGIMFSLEITFTMILSVMIARINSEALAAYQIAGQWEWFLMIMTYGFTESIMILGSKAYGAKNYTMMKCYFFDALFFSLICSLCGVILLVSFPNLFISIDLDPNLPINAEIVNYVKRIFIFLCFVKILESYRITITSMLRALSMTNFPMWVAFFMFWVVGIPLCYYLTFTLKLALDGIFYGLIIILAITSIIVTYKLKHTIIKLTTIKL